MLGGSRPPRRRWCASKAKASAAADADAENGAAVDGSVRALVGDAAVAAAAAAPGEWRLFYPLRRTRFNLGRGDGGGSMEEVRSALRPSGARRSSASVAPMAAGSRSRR